MTPKLVPLTDNEIKMLVVAIRQVQHTFTVAEAQSAAAGERLAEDYDSVREAYESLHEKLAALIGEAAPRTPRIVK